LQEPIKIYEFDATEKPSIAEKYQIQLYPQVVLFSKGKKLFYAKDLKSSEALLEWTVKKVMQSPFIVTTKEQMDYLFDRIDIIIAFFGDPISDPISDPLYHTI